MKTHANHNLALIYSPDKEIAYVNKRCEMVNIEEFSN